MTAYERLLASLDSAGKRARQDKPNHAMAQCPAHEDRNPSLSIRRFPQRVRIKCFTGCADEDVLAALGLQVSDLFDDPRGQSWSYPDGWQVFRTPDKKIRQSGPKTNGRTPSALYRADMVGRAKAAGRTVYLVEGEPDAEAICDLGEAATTSRMGANNFHLADVSPLFDADIIAVPDQDEAGETWARAVKDTLADKAKSLTFRRAKHGKDVSDHLTAGLELADLEPWELPPSKLLAGLRTGEWLDQQRFDPLQWIVRELFPEGFSLLVGAPKIGKSWLSLSVALAVAAGGYVFGRIKVERRPVLLLALEDSDRRLQDRMRKLLGPREPIPAGLDYITWLEPTQVLATVRDWLDTLPKNAKPLVILDTLGKVMPIQAQGESQYQRDYKVSGALKRLCDGRPGSAVIGLHHDRKSATEDFVEAVSGTHGLAGAADTVVLIKRQRQESKAVLKVTGRDVREAEYQLELTRGIEWNLVGDGLLAAAKAAEEEEIVDGLGDTNASIVRYVRSFPEGVRAHEIAKQFDMTNEEVGRNLSRLVASARLKRAGRGLYTEVTELVTRARDARARVSLDISDESDELSSSSSDSSLSSHSSGGTYTREAELITNCTICGHVLHQSLIDSGETTHPNC